MSETRWLWDQAAEYLGQPRHSEPRRREQPRTRVYSYAPEQDLDRGEVTEPLLGPGDFYGPLAGSAIRRGAQDASQWLVPSLMRSVSRMAPYLDEALRAVRPPSVESPTWQKIEDLMGLPRGTLQPELPAGPQRPGLPSAERLSLPSAERRSLPSGARRALPAGTGQPSLGEWDTSRLQAELDVARNRLEAGMGEDINFSHGEFDLGMHGYMYAQLAPEPQETLQEYIERLIRLEEIYNIDEMIGPGHFPPHRLEEMRQAMLRHPELGQQRAQPFSTPEVEGYAREWDAFVKGHNASEQDDLFPDLDLSGVDPGNAPAPDTREYDRRYMRRRVDLSTGQPPPVDPRQGPPETIEQIIGDLLKRHQERQQRRAQGPGYDMPAREFPGSRPPAPVMPSVSEDERNLSMLLDVRGWMSRHPGEPVPESMQEAFVQQFGYRIPSDTVSLNPRIPIYSREQWLDDSIALHLRLRHRDVVPPERIIRESGLPPLPPGAHEGDDIPF